nr:hypothetical protein Iba_chr13aCG11140 [Ipomoea batatas]
MVEESSASVPLAKVVKTAKVKCKLVVEEESQPKEVLKVPKKSEKSKNKVVEKSSVEREQVVKTPIPQEPMQVADVVSENVTEVNIGIAKVIEVEVSLPLTPTLRQINVDAQLAQQMVVEAIPEVMYDVEDSTLSIDEELLIELTARTVVEADTPRNPTHVVLNTKVEDATRSELVDVPRSPTAREVEGLSSTVGQMLSF